MKCRKHITLLLGVLLCSQLFGQSSLQDTVHLQEFDIVHSKRVSLNTATSPKRIDETLTKITGVTLIKRGNYAAEPVFRGLNGGQMSLTIDGMRIFSACTDKMDPVSSYVASNNLASIEISGNDNAASMGSSIGGAINFNTKQPQVNAPEKFSGNFNQSYNSNANGLNSNLAFILSDSNWAIGINSNYQNFQNYTAGGGKKIQYTQFEKVNIAINTTFMLSAKETLKAQFIYDDAHNVGYAALPMDVSFAGGRIYALSYKRYLTNGSLTLKAYGNNITHIMDDSKRPDVPIRMDMPGKSNTYGMFAQMEFHANKKHHLIITPDYYFNQSFADMTMYPNSADRPDEPTMYMITWPDVYRHSASVDFADHFQINDSNQLHINAKYEYVTSMVQSEFGKKQLHSLGFDATTPSTYHLTTASLKYLRTINHKINAYGSLGYAERQPTVSEGFGYYLFNSQDAFDYIGVPDLKKERAVKMELGLSAEIKSIYVNGSVFHYQFADYVLGIVNSDLDGMTIGSKGVKVYENLPSASISGIELTLKTSLFHEIELKNVSTYTYGIDNQGAPLPLIPPFRNVSQFRYRINKFALRADVILVASQNEFNAYAGEESTPSYGLLNVGASKQFSLLKQNASFGLSADNIFDSYYWDHMDWNSIPRPGISINAMFMMQF